jgi:hypothetical protein
LACGKIQALGGSRTDEFEQKATEETEGPLAIPSALCSLRCLLFLYARFDRLVSVGCISRSDGAPIMEEWH